MKKTFIYLFAMLTAASCQHKELCYDHPHTQPLQVVFDWTQAPTASPASMSLYLFPDTGAPFRNEFTERTGGEIRAAYGRYDALCLNSDTEAVEYRNTEKPETFEVTTVTTTLIPELSGLGVRSEGAPMAPGAEGERIAAAPEMIWCDRRAGFSLSAEDHLLTLCPSAAVGRCTVEIRNAANLAHVKGLSASLSGMAGGFLAGAGTASAERVTIPFEIAASSENTITGLVRTFGHCPSEQTAHTLIVYAVLSDGSKWYYSYDVTDQIHSAPDQRDIHILLNKLPLPEPNPGGFQPSVDEWQAVDVDIEM